MCKLVEKLVLFCILKTQGRYFVERHGSGVKLQTLDYENPGSNPVLQCFLFYVAPVHSAV